MQIDPTSNYPEPHPVSQVPRASACPLILLTTRAKEGDYIIQVINVLNYIAQLQGASQSQLGPAIAYSTTGAPSMRRWTSET